MGGKTCFKSSQWGREEEGERRGAAILVERVGARACILCFLPFLPLLHLFVVCELWGGGLPLLPLVNPSWIRPQGQPRGMLYRFNDLRYQNLESLMAIK